LQLLQSGIKGTDIRLGLITRLQKPESGCGKAKALREYVSRDLLRNNKDLGKKIGIC